MNARNFVDYTSDRSHCESRMREICTYGLTRRRARPVRPSLLYCFPVFPLKDPLEHSLAPYSCSCTIALPYSSSLMSATAVLCLAT